MNRLRRYLNELDKVLKPEKDEKEKKGAKSLPPVFKRNVITVVGLKRTAGRFLPVSHEGYSNETYVDKVSLLGMERAEFIARKLKGIERRAHMSLFRNLIDEHLEKNWDESFRDLFGKPCTIPGGLCGTCWNCSLFGAMEAGKGGTFSRARYFDTWSLESAETCVASQQSDEGMGIGNTVNENLREQRGSDSYHLYEYVKAGTYFPFITIIESPTTLDVAGYIQAVRLADLHGYGKYNTNHGKFETEFLAVAPGMPRFSILSLLEAKGRDEIVEGFEKGTYRFDAKEESIVRGHAAVLALGDQVEEEFNRYLQVIR